MKSTITFLLFFLTSILSFSQVKTPSSADKYATIDSVLNQILKDQHVAGFSVAIVKGDEVIYSKGFGYRDVENKKPVTPNTLFAIGSSTKAFTASLIGLLQKDGKLTLEDKATSVLPSLRFYNDEMNAQITIRDLMTHRTGLPRYDFSWFLFNTSNRDSMIHRVRYMQPTAGVREKWQYNNFMYLAQGIIVEKMSGKTWEQNIKEKFFDPLEMKRSTTDFNVFKNDPDVSLPYVVVKDTVIQKIPYYNINGMGPAGSINSSANDMANWLKIWISGGFYKKKEILPTNYIAEAASSQMVMAAGLPGVNEDIHIANYGLGWMISSYRGHYMVEHGGNINGFSAEVAFFPGDELGIVVLTNQNSSQAPNLMRNSIADRILKLKAINWNGDAKAKAASLNQKANTAKKNPIVKTTPSHPLKEYTGTFENPAYGLIKVILDKDALIAFVGDDKLFLKHIYYDVFVPKPISKDGEIDTAESKTLFNFASNQEGKIESVSMPLDGDSKTVFTFKPEIKVLSLKDLEKYVGDYLLGTVTVKVYLKGNTLFVLVPGQPEYETVPAEEGAFDLRILKGYSVKFEAAVDKKSPSLSFIQPNGTFKAVRKN
jgi:CubicO group peptidase (beta-lactamase class C family)